MRTSRCRPTSAAALRRLAGLAGVRAARARPAVLGGLGGLGGFAAPRQDVGNKIKVTPHINESNQVRPRDRSGEQRAGRHVRHARRGQHHQAHAPTPPSSSQDQQTVVIGGLMSDAVHDVAHQGPVLGDLPLLGRVVPHLRRAEAKKNLLLVLTPHVIRDQEDLRKIFERKMQERQEFLDRYMVFSGEDWKPPHDWSRTNGLVEDIRKAFAEIAEQERLEEESKPRENPPREPSEPIELPGDVQGGGAAPQPAARACAPAPQPRRGSAPLRPGAAAAAPAAPPARQLRRRARPQGATSRPFASTRSRAA